MGIRGAFALWLVLLFATAAAAAPQPPDDLEIPGGVAPLARALGLDPLTATEPHLIVEIAHLAYNVPEGQGANGRMVPQLRHYLDTLDIIAALGGAVTRDSLKGDAANGPALLAALGLAFSADGAQIVPLAGAAGDLRRELFERAGFDLTQIADELNQGKRVTLGAPSGRVPLPLGAGAWKALLPEKIAARPLYRAILEDRQACLLYAGLRALDPPTLQAIGSIRNLPADLYDRAANFADMSSGLQIKDGSVVPPGGREAAPLWEAVVGERLADPGAFIRRLFSRDGGRVAYLFDTIASFDPARQRYALGLWHATADHRRERFRRLASVFASADSSWRIRFTPFARPPIDAALALRAVAVNADGTPLSVGSGGFWSAVFDDPDLERARQGHPSEEQSADAAWLVSRILDPPIAQRRQRVDRMQFAARLIARGVKDADTVVLASHGFARFPALMLTLERMDVQDAGLYRDAARRAASFSSIDGGAQVRAAIALFQGSLAVIDRARFARTLTADAATTLVRSLVAVPVTGGGYEGAIASWFEETLLPALTGDGGERSSADAVIVRALAGRRAAQPVTLEWEGARYRVDVADAEAARLARLRRDQAGSAIAPVLAFARAAQRADTSGRLSEAVAAALAAVVIDRDPVALDGLRDAVRDAQQAVRDGRLSGGDRMRLIRLGDRLLAYALLALAYAVNLGDADADPTTIFDPALGDRHDFGANTSLAWEIPHEDSGAGRPWHLEGSLLGLDVGLARFALHRLSLEPPSQAPRVSSNDRHTFAESVALLNPFDLRDDDLPAIAAAIARGRERAQRVTPDGVDEFAEQARLSAWQREGMRWLLQRNLPADVSFTLVDLFWLGAPPPGLVDRIDAWGMSGRPIDGSLRLTFPRADPWDGFSGRPSLGLLASRTPDMLLRVAVALSELKLPAALARGVVSGAMLDLVDEAPLGHHDDQRAVAKYAETVPLSRMRDYISFLTAAGPLIPVAERIGAVRPPEIRCINFACTPDHSSWRSR